jgi:hypothetical protein
MGTVPLLLSPGVFDTPPARVYAHPTSVFLKVARALHAQSLPRRRSPPHKNMKIALSESTTCAV